MISDRKRQHLEICLKEKVEDKSCFDDIILVYNAMPNLDFNEIDTSVEFLGKKLSLPLLISSMTGGTKEAEQINKDLAEIAEQKKIGFALGSQRAMIENKELTCTYSVRNVAPSTLVLGNIGLANLNKIEPKEIEKALSSIGADALFLHINPAHELAQKEGDINLKNSNENLKKLIENLNYPVVIKEVGYGISKETGKKLKDLGIKTIDVAGFGGTNWVKVEKLRGGKLADDFVDFGIRTPCSLLELKDIGVELISSGGIRSGLDIAKSIALGAKICAIALPFLKVYDEKGKEGVEKYIYQLEKELKTAMFLVGAKNIEELRNKRYILKGFTKNWAEQL
ncbi:MAG: type 2 isopentenyl-diphosphate Delta-isomerase [Candidatus Aenigmarchaeota archaeon]|nr:type 2 isopentenyl-diphosphate Delta-isomerase [Candidatus Aenigmarchaeota archaeon]